MSLLDWVKDSLGLVTVGDLRFYLKTIEFRDIYESRSQYDNHLERVERRILARIFKQYFKDKPTRNSLETLFMFSQPFKDIVLQSLQLASKKYGNRVEPVVKVSARAILINSRPKASEIFHSAINSTIQLMIDLPVTYPDGSEQSTRQGWERFNYLLKQLGP